MATTNTTASDHTLDDLSSNGIPNPNDTPHPPSNPPNPFPIVIAGGGCVGLFLALLLAQSRIPQKIIILEPQHPDATSTRAMAHQPPTYPIFNKVPGLLPELVRAGSLSSGLCFRTSLENGNRVIANKTFENGGEGMRGKGQLLLPQGRFQEVLMRRLAEFGGRVDVRLGSSVTSSTPLGNSVEVHVTSTSTSSSSMEPSSQSIRATYLIDATGAHSTLRKHLGISLDGETLDAQLVATDLYFDFHAHGFYDANFIIDPQCYGLIGRISPKRDGEPVLWRVSYGVPVGMSGEEIKRGVDEKLSVMLPNGGRDEKGDATYKVLKVAPYKAHQRLASTLYHRESRTCLVGDAAHLTNPYAGLGLASGMADAASLSDVLIRIFSGQVTDEEKLLGAWSEARRKKFADAIDKPSRIAYKRVKTDVSTEEKVKEMMERDPLVAALKKGMPVQPPSLETKGEELEGW